MENKNNWKQGVKEACDQIAFKRFLKAELEFLHNPTEENYNDAKEKLDVLTSRGIDLKTYKI